VIKDIIVLFRVSKKSVDKIICGRERKENNSARYLSVRVFFKSVYDRLMKKDSINCMKI
jgi:hypothetical protein